MDYSKSIDAFADAVQIIPGGVNSPVRSFKSVECNPLFIQSGQGAYITDIDNNTFIDYVGSWGPMIHGHAHASISKALYDAIPLGTSYGAPTLWETRMAECIIDMVPSIEMVRMVNSGTEATMSALRLARGFTGRAKVIKFEGCYHGHHDSFLIQAGSGALTLSTPNSPGVTPSTAQDTLLAQFNSIESVRALFEQYGAEIAAVIVEPIAGNMGVVVPLIEFLEGLRSLCTQYGALLIFDEVMTGFRVARGGAQELYGITPDITTLGKIIGGGLPVGAYGGKKEIMQHLAPQGLIYQAGTLSGNPLAMAAGYASLQMILQNKDFYQQLEQSSEQLENGIRNVLELLQIPAVINRVGSMFTLFFTQKACVQTYADVCTCDTKKYAAFFKHSLDAGIYLAPSQFEAAFVSSAHSEFEINKTLEASSKALQSIKTM